MPNDETELEQQEPDQPEQETHTAREVELLRRVDTLESEIANLKEENRKLFILNGGEGADKPESDPVDDAIKMCIDKRGRV